MNIKKINYLLFLFSLLFRIFLSLPSQEIWLKTRQYLNKYSIFSFNIHYFIYDEGYIDLDPTSSLIEGILDKQKLLYENYTLNNYIFLIKNLYESQESIEDVVDNLATKIENTYIIKIKNSVITLFSIETHKMHIRTGKDIMNTITNNEAKEILADLKTDLRNQNYYNACILLIEKIGYYYTHNLSSLYIYIILGVIALIIIFIVIYYIKCVCLRLPRDDDLIVIVDFLKKLKNDKKIFFDNCLICLKEFHPEHTDDLILINDSKTLQIPFTNPDKEISTLPCRHQYHKECFDEWTKLKNVCPLCFYCLPDNGDYGIVVWNIQLIKHPTFSNIKYEHLYTWKFRTRKYISSGDYDGYDGGGDFSGGGDCGGGCDSGGATDSW